MGEFAVGGRGPATLCIATIFILSLGMAGCSSGPAVLGGGAPVAREVAGEAAGEDGAVANAPSEQGDGGIDRAPETGTRSSQAGDGSAPSTPGALGMGLPAPAADAAADAATPTATTDVAPSVDAAPSVVGDANPADGTSEGDRPIPAIDADAAAIALLDAPADGDIDASVTQDSSSSVAVGNAMEGGGEDAARATPEADGDAPPDGNASANGTDGADADAALGFDCSTQPADHPTHLACTGLYADWPSRTIASSARAFAPGAALWSDGAEKRRWIQLPAGTRIDTSNLDEWKFPVGTKLWKEFAVGGKLAETRFLWKRDSATWFRTTFAWSLDGTTATELTGGMPNWNGTTYEIPSQSRCDDCHEGRIDGVLGFEVIGLSMPEATGLTLAELEAESLLTQPPAAAVVIPGNPTESAALAWLHANCGTACHNQSPNSFTQNSGITMYLRLNVAQLASVQSTDTWRTAVGQALTEYSPPDPKMLRITPRNLAESAIYYRDSRRDPSPNTDEQMPPFDTHLVPTDPATGVAVPLVAAWIESMR